VLFKGVALTRGVAFRRVLLTQHLAQTVEVRLRAGALSLRVDLSTLDEFGDGQRHEVMSSLQAAGKKPPK
jgi:hypothetical protein